MDVLDQLAAVREGGLCRRSFLRSLSSVGVASVGLTALPTHASVDPIFYFTWYGYGDPIIHHEYRERHGHIPQVAYFSDAEEAYAKLRTGYKVDLAHSEVYQAPRWIRSGLFQPIPKDALANLPTVFPELYSFPWNDAGKGLWFVPFDWGHTSVLYRPDLYDLQGPESWDILWDERYAGRLGGMESVYDTWLTAAIKAGVDFDHIAGDDAFERVRAALRRQQPLIRDYYNEAPTMHRAMANKEIVAAVAWNSSALELRSSGVPVRFARPREGRLLWIGGLMVHRDCKSPERAVEVIDSMLSTTAGQFIIGQYGYGHANKLSFDTLPADHLAMIGMDGDLECELAENHNVEPQDDAWYQRVVKEVETIKYGF